MYEFCGINFHQISFSTIIYFSQANTPLAKAIELKKEGNKLFGARDYEAAIKLYTEAIAICPPDNKKELATFYQNRAACYEHLKQYDLVIKDCSQAVHYDKLYIKAYLRRGKGI